MLGNFLNSIQERKKSVNGLVGADIPRASGFVWISYYSSFSKWTTTTTMSRTYRGRHARNFGRGPVCGFQSRPSREQCGRAGARDVAARDRRTNVRPPSVHPRSRDKRKNRTPRSEFAASSPLVAHASSYIVVEWNDRFEPFHLSTWLEKGGVEISCSLFVNLLAFEIYRSTGR